MHGNMNVNCWAYLHLRSGNLQTRNGRSRNVPTRRSRGHIWVTTPGAGNGKFKKYIANRQTAGDIAQGDLVI